MNWRNFASSPTAAHGVLRLPPAAAAFWLEGSLAAMPTLAPVIAMFPLAGPGSPQRRRPGRQKA